MSIDILHAAIAEAEAALAKVKTVASEIFGEAETDAAQVAQTAETSGLTAAGHQAEGDAATLAQTAVADVTAIPAPATAPTTPATPTA